MLSHRLTRDRDAFVVARLAAEFIMAVLSSHWSQEQSSENELERTVAFACRIAAENDAATVRSVRVVGGRRLTGAELIRLHSAASPHGLRLTMDGSGMITIRQAPPAADRDRAAETDESAACT